MPWLDPIDWNIPANMPLSVAITPCPLWTSDTTFTLFWVAIAPEEWEFTLAPCRQDFTVATGTIEPVGDAVMMEGIDVGFSWQAFVSDAGMGPDGSYWLTFGEIGGS